jgi:hypothetical protein
MLFQRHLDHRLDLETHGGGVYAAAIALDDIVLLHVANAPPARRCRQPDLARQFRHRDAAILLEFPQDPSIRGIQSVVAGFLGNSRAHDVPDPRLVSSKA